MSKAMPFVLFKRKDNPVYFAKFYDENTHQYYATRKTNETDERKASIVAMRMLADVESQKSKSLKKSQLQRIVKTSDLSQDELLCIAEELKRQGLLASFTLKNSAGDIDADQYFREFWDWNKSPYVREKLAHGQSIHFTHVDGMLKNYNKHLSSMFRGKVLGGLTRQDMFAMFDFVGSLDCSGSTKNVICRTVLTPLKYAHSKEMISQDLTTNLIFFAINYKEREILTPELAREIFSVGWDCKGAKLANMLAMLTGLRAGEIRGLRLCDLGENCLYVRHSWSDKEGLKCPKNGEERTVQFPYPQIIESLKEYYWTNPFAYESNTIDQFIFYGLKPRKPIDTDIFIDGLRGALIKVGISKEESQRYTFHAWRHFYATFMADKLSTKLVQSQTGHKTKAMLEHYANHMTSEEIALIQSAQVEAFRGILPE